MGTERGRKKKYDLSSLFVTSVLNGFGVGQHGGHTNIVWCWQVVRTQLLLRLASGGHTSIVEGWPLVDTHLLLGVGVVVVTPIVWRSGGHTPIVWRSGGHTPIVWRSCGHTGLGIRSFQKNVPFFPIFCVLL